MDEIDCTQLFSHDPRVRLKAAIGAIPSMARDYMPQKDQWIRNAFGAANAWMVAVGPSPGKGPGGKVLEPVAPILGKLHPLFEQWAISTPFWRELFRLVREGFCHAGFGNDDEEIGLKLLMLMNLDLTPEGDSTKIAHGKLTSGLPRLKRVLEVTRPRLILALEQHVYDEISKWWSDFGAVGSERLHAKVSKYTPRSRWLTRNGEAILLTKTLQHPSKANFYLGFEQEVAGCLGDRIAEAATC